MVLLVVKFNGQVHGYDFDEDERRAYHLQTKDDWAKFRMLRINRQLDALSLTSKSAHVDNNGIKKTRRKNRRNRKNCNSLFKPSP